MEISNNTFSSIIRNYDIEKINEQTQKTDLTKQNGLPELDKASNTDGFVRSDGSVADISDINFVSTYSVEETNNTVTATSEAETYANSSSITNEELNYIKKLIYNSHHSFIENFRDADTFFEYVHDKQDSTVTKETGISRSQLIALTQNDKWEDSHNDFFGSLNRSFYSLDKDNNGTLSYAEVKDFLNTYLKKDGYNDFKTQVQAYSDEIQKKFDEKSNQEKLEFALKLTEDYLKSAGLKNQLEALNRLKAGIDLDPDTICKVGQISIVEYENENQLGGYTSWQGYKSYTNANPNGDDVDKAYGEIPNSNKTTPGKPTKLSNGDGTYTQTIGYFTRDDDFYYTDDDREKQLSNNGLTLSVKYLEKGTSWAELVATLVHELTHATYSLFSTNGKTDGAISITQDNLTALRQMGALTDEEYELAKENIKDLNDKYGQYMVTASGNWLGGKDMSIDDNNIINNATSLTAEESAILDKLTYKISAARGEYMAYQADANYLDSVGGDIFNKRVGDVGSDMAVDGKNEKDTIIKHLELCGYNTGLDDDLNKTQDNEVLPDWKWWSYA